MEKFMSMVEGTSSEISNVQQRMKIFSENFSQKLSVGFP